MRASFWYFYFMQTFGLALFLKVFWGKNPEIGKISTPSSPKHSGLVWMIVALNQTWLSNQKAKFWFSANQLGNFEVSIDPRKTYFKIVKFFPASGDIFLFSGNYQFPKSPLYFAISGVFCSSTQPKEELLLGFPENEWNPWKWAEAAFSPKRDEKKQRNKVYWKGAIWFHLPFKFF